MRNKKHKLILLLMGLLFPVICCDAVGVVSFDGYSHITIKESEVHGVPKGSSIQATIDGHYLTIVFLENLGQVHVVVTTDTGGEVDAVFTETPTYSLANVNCIPVGFDN